MTSTAKRPPAVVLLVEDDLGDQILTQEAFRGLKVPCELRIVGDGKEALDYLYRRGSFESDCSAPRPDLILLDLNMPRVNGQQVAEQVHADPDLRGIPVVVLTTSQREEDVVRAYGRGVASFIRKPLDFKLFMAAVQQLEHLIKFVATLKSLRGRTRLTDRQIYRVLRHQQQLEHLVDTLFDHQINQIESFLARRGGEPDPPGVAESFTQESIVRLAQKILGAGPAEKALLGGPVTVESSGAGGQAGPAGPASGLLELARALESPREESLTERRSTEKPDGGRREEAQSSARGCTEPL